jgi:iron complex outermembrane receptor protein
MNFHRSFLAGTALLTSFASAGSALAQEVTQLPDLHVRDELASSVQRANELRHQSPNAKIVIEAEQLNQFNDQNVGDALRRLPGVTYAGPNRSRSIKLRGLGKEYTTVLLDGRPIIDGDSSRAMEVDRLPTIFVERVEIIRSPLASQESPGAAGTVNIITKRHFGPAGGAISVGGGNVENFGTAGDVSSWIGGEAGPVRYFVGAGYQRRLLEESNNTFNYKGVANTPNRATFQDQKRTFDEYTALGRFEYKANDANTFIVSPTFLRTDELRAQTESRTNAAMSYIDQRTVEQRNRIRESYGSYFEWLHAYNNFVTGSLFVDVQQAREDTTRNSLQTAYNANGTVNGTPKRGYTFNPIDLDRVAPGGKLVANWNGHTTEMGAGLNRLMRSENDSGRSDGSRTYDITEDVYYAYLSDSVSLLGPDRLTAGLRLEHSVLATRDFAGRTTDKDDTNLNPSLQYRYSATPDLDLRAGVARTVRRPDLRDLTPTIRTSDGTPVKPDTRGNPDASPEKIWGADVGADYYFYDRLGILSANVFARSFEDKLERRLTHGYAGYPSRWISELRNAGNGEAYGLELDGRVPLRMINMPNLTLWANATFVKTELTDSETQQTRRFAEQPDVVTNIGVDYYVEAWRTTFGLNYNRVFSYSQDILQRTGTSIATLGLANVRTEYNTLNRIDASIKVALAPNWNVSFSALNLTRPVFRTKQTTYTTAGLVDSVVKYEEPSHSVYYVRTSYTW